MKSIFLFCCISLSSILITYILTPRPYQVHYHANFAAYIEGKSWDFGKDIYMEEVSRCNIETGVRPEDRIHLHDNKGSLVHVHMAASTWGDLAANLLWGMGSGYIVDDYGKMYLPKENKSIYYILNGEVVRNPGNIPVGSEDRLLIWYGSGSEEEVRQQFDILVPKDAHEYNKKADPASCSSNTYGEWLSPIIETIQEFFPHSHN